MNDFGRGEKTRLSKVYFIWVIRDFGSAEWFHSLLEAIEAEDTEQRIEIHIYLTAKITEDQMNNILVCSAAVLELPRIARLQYPPTLSATRRRGRQGCHHVAAVTDPLRQAECKLFGWMTRPLAVLLLNSVSFAVGPGVRERSEQASRHGLWSVVSKAHTHSAPPGQN
jgi:hypothetical protein